MTPTTADHNPLRRAGRAIQRQGQVAHRPSRRAINVPLTEA